MAILAQEQLVRARTIVLILFFVNLVGLLLSGIPDLVIAGACWWLALLPLGRSYRWFMGSAALVAVATGASGILVWPDIDVKFEGTWSVGAVGALSLVGPLLFSQAMVLFSDRAGFPASLAHWRRARMALLLAYALLIGWILLSSISLHSGLDGDESGAIVISGMFALPLSLTFVVSIFLFILALFETQREIHRYTTRPPRRRTSESRAAS
ncbi:MAG TPA: hypothetical protein VMS76_01765 [Planctomycetota bacterium]|nr:hypothetical protein [Planctomycetota bacterium]